MKFSLISIIIPNFNKSKFILETLESISHQTYNNWEALIIDDLSTDDSLLKIEDYIKKDKRFKIVKNNINQGANVCRNQGLNMANGAYILFLDADDLLSSTCLEKRVHKSSKTTDAVVFPMGLFAKKLGDINQTFNWIPKEDNALNKFLSHDLPWSIVQPLWRASVLKELKGFDTEYSRLQDVDLHTRALLKFNNIKCFPNEKADCFYRIDDTRHSDNKYSFFTKWVKSAVRYYETFENEPINNIKTLLSGTILATLSQLLNAYNLNQLSKSEIKKLKKQLLVVNLPKRSSFLLKSYFFIQFNIKKRIPGLRWITNKLIGL